MRRKIRLIGGCLAASLWLTACGGTPSPPIAPPTATVALPTAMTTEPALTPTRLPSPPTTPASTATPTTARPATPTAPVATRTSAKPSIETETEAPAASVREARAALERLDSYRLSSVITENSGSQLKMTLAYVAPDRLRMTAHDDGGGAVFDMVAIGQTTYIWNNDAWQTFHGGLEGTGGGALIQLLDPNALLARMESGQVTVVGQETIDGAPCTIYEQTQDAAQRRLWVGSDDNLVRKIEGRDESSAFVLTITDINAPIEIEPPM